MEAKKLNNLTKRAQITASGKTVFIWVAAGSVVAAFALVAIIFLTKELVFREKVLAAKTTTLNNLNNNREAAKTLKTNVNLLLSDANLNSVKTTSDSSNLQVIFDALPTNYDSANFGASLQGVLLNGTVASIQNLSVASPDDTSGTSIDTTTSIGDGVQTMPFDLAVTGSADQIRTALTNMEQSIRPIKINSISIESGSPLLAHISGETYFDPAVNLSLGKTIVKP